MVGSIRCFSTSGPTQIFGFLSKTLQNSQPKAFKVEPVLKPIGLVQPVHLNVLNKASSGIGKQIFDKDVRMQKRAEIGKELAVSGMHDVHIFRKTKGKVFISPPFYFKQEKSLYFPNFIGEKLDGSKGELFGSLKGKASILRVYTALSGDQCSQTFFSAQNNTSYLYPNGYEEFKKKYPLSQIIDINITENYLKSLFVKMSKGSIKASLPKERQNQFFIIPRKLFPADIRDEINLINLYTGYIYLVDSQGRIRWAACGESTAQESEILWKCVQGLEKEIVDSH